jgi:hypothetical protein
MPRLAMPTNPYASHHDDDNGISSSRTKNEDWMKKVCWPTTQGTLSFSSPVARFTNETVQFSTQNNRGRASQWGWCRPDSLSLLLFDNEDGGGCCALWLDHRTFDRSGRHSLLLGPIILVAIIIAAAIGSVATQQRVGIATR